MKLRLGRITKLPAWSSMLSIQQDWDWTGRNDETGIMMRLAVEAPKIFADWWVRRFCRYVRISDE